MKFLLSLIPSVLFAQLAQLPGNWVNENAAGGIPHVSIRTEGARIIVHVWGNCTPVDCDWGEADADLWNGIPMAIYKMGYATSRVQFIPTPDGRLIVAMDRQYHDDSARKFPGKAEYFVRRETVQPTAEAAAARALLRQTAETYRNLPPAYFETISTETRTTSRSEVRTTRRSKIYAAPPNKFRVETAGNGESSVRILDGASEWTFYPAANEYLTNPQAKGFVNTPFASFALLDQSAGDPSIAGHDNGASQVRIALEHGVTVQVWIDDATHLVRRWVFDEGRAKSELEIPLARLGETPSPTLFTFDPAASGAKYRRELTRGAQEAMTGKLAPDFTLRDLDGRTVQLSSLRGKPVLLDFWATWCGYCRQELPSIELLHRGLKDRIAVFGIDNETPELPRDYLQKFGYTLPTLIDAESKTVNLYHLDGWPTTILIGADGKILYYESGFEPEKLRDALRAAGVW
jgi:thiol-disulfide isomerase/thioredoxin/outer membrane lipoprotein-sorting protein